MLKCVHSIGNAKGDGGATRPGVQYVVAVLGPGYLCFQRVGLMWGLLNPGVP